MTTFYITFVLDRVVCHRYIRGMSKDDAVRRLEEECDRHMSGCPRIREIVQY